MLAVIKIFIVLLFVGSNIYIVDTSLSLLNVYFAALLLFTPFLVKKITYSKEVISFFSLNLLLVFIAALYLVTTYDDPMEIKDFYYLFYILFVPFLLYSAYKVYGFKLLETIYNYVFIMLALSLVVILVEIKTGFHLPVHNEEEAFRNVPSGFFTNPNDMASIAIMLYPFMLFTGIKQNKIFKTIIITLITIAISGICFSRISLIILICLPLFWLLIKQKYVLFVFLFTGAVFGILMLMHYKMDYYKDPENIWERNINRVASFLDQDNRGEDSSFSQRFMIYSTPFEAPQNYVIGYGFRGSLKALKKNPLLWVKDPHSFPIELIYNFGFLGFLPFFFAILFLLYKIMVNFKIDEVYRYGLVQLIYFLLLVNISSSVMKKPVVWIPYSIVMLITVIPQKQLLQFFNSENYET